MKSKQIIIMLLSFIILFAIGCGNEDKTGSDGSGIGGGGGSGGSGISGGGSGGLTEILTPEEGTYTSSGSPYNITVKMNTDGTIQLSGKAISENYKNEADMTVDYSFKTSDWTKQSSSDYKVAKNIVSEDYKPGQSTLAKEAEAKWCYINDGGKYIELDINFNNLVGRPFKASARKRATK